MAEVNIITFASLEPAWLLVISKDEKLYRIFELPSNSVNGIHKSFFHDAVVVYSRDRLALIDKANKGWPDFRLAQETARRL